MLVLIAFSSLASLEARAEAVCVVKPNVSLRKEPKPKAAVSWAVPRFMPLMIVGQQGKWAKVQDLEGETHWVLRSNLSSRTSCAVVRTKTAKLRKGPGHDQPPADLARVDKYTPFKKVDRDGEWVKVQDDFNVSYWVHETNIWIPMNRTSVTF